MNEYNQPDFKRRDNRQRSHTLLCEKCGKRPMAMESWWCKECKDD